MNQRFKIFFHKPGFKLMMVLLILFVIYKFYLNYQEELYLKQEIIRINKEIEIAKTVSNELHEEIENVNNLEYIEKIARKKLGLVKPGELLIIPIENKTE